MNARDRKPTDIAAYLETKDRSAHIARTRFTEAITIKVSPLMRNAIKAFGEKHGLSMSEVFRTVLDRDLVRLDKELTRKEKDLSR